jgi:succinoglycan biosynthesis transport protein ExoP
MDNEQMNRRLERILGFLERRMLLIVACVALPVAAVYVISKPKSKRYTARAYLVFNEKQLGQRVARLPVTSSSGEQLQRSINVTLVQRLDTAKTAGVVHMSKQAVSAALSVSAPGTPYIVDVSARAGSPGLAERIANTYAEEFVADQQKINHSYYDSALRPVAKRLAALFSKERSSRVGRGLQGLALAALADLRNGKVRLAPAASARASSSSLRSRNTILAAVLGLLFGLAVAFLLERFDWRIRDPEELGAIYRLPLLGAVPESTALARALEPGSRAGREALPKPEADAFYLIRARLRYFNFERDLRTLLVSSAQSGDGKTTIARQLAVAAASMGSTVLLVEADLRRPSLAAQLDIAARPGVIDVVSGSVSLWRATKPVTIDQPHGVARRPLAIDVLVAGDRSPANPAELIESPAMAALLEQAQEAYDLVVLDTAPLSDLADAFPLLRKVDGVVVVARMRRSQRPAAERLRETLDLVGAPVLGVVANDVKARWRHEPYDAYAEEGQASAEQGAAELGDERLLAESEPPSASPGDLAAPDADGAEAGSSQGAPASVDPPPRTGL